MTDYASQGKTRPYNVVNLNDNHSHQSYHTALSHSATAAGALITQSFHPQKITGGASGALQPQNSHPPKGSHRQKKFPVCEKGHTTPNMDLHVTILLYLWMSIFVSLFAVLSCYKQL
ncbi:hypothetical protein L208DRAFT_1233547 [Tricholoma matsutake]|nr:hypothetical protein L208DRAFT_1233547 [Tricholoma matsutake 945]